MKTATFFAITAIVLFAFLGGCNCSNKSSATNHQAKDYEYKVMSLYDMFNYSEPLKEKVMQLVVQANTGVMRTDMDCPDYTEALNRLAGEGWELVTVNKSNYWIFRRPKTGDAVQSKK